MRPVPGPRPPHGPPAARSPASPHTASLVLLTLLCTRNMLRRPLHRHYWASSLPLRNPLPLDCKPSVHSDQVTHNHHHHSCTARPLPFPRLPSPPPPAGPRPCTPASRSTWSSTAAWSCSTAGSQCCRWVWGVCHSIRHVSQVRLQSGWVRWLADGMSRAERRKAGPGVRGSPIPAYGMGVWTFGRPPGAAGQQVRRAVDGRGARAGRCTRGGVRCFGLFVRWWGDSVT